MFGSGTSILGIWSNFLVPVLQVLRGTGALSLVELQIGHEATSVQFAIKWLFLFSNKCFTLFYHQIGFYMSTIGKPRCDVGESAVGQVSTQYRYPFKIAIGKLPVKVSDPPFPEAILIHFTHCKLL